MLHHTTETSIDDDLFLTTTTATNDIPAASIIYDTTTSNKVIAPSRHSRQQSTLESSFDSMEVVDMTSTWKMKILVLVSMLSLPVGCHYLEATLGTLKTTLKHVMQINNTQFSILLSSVTLVNTILPLFAGIFIDDVSSLGSIRATTIVSCVIFLGSLLVSIGATYDSYPCMMSGQIVYGLGGGMIVTMQEGILSRWFRDKEVTIVIGIMLCTARLTKWAAKMVTYPILNSTGSHAWPIHVATIFCAAGAVMNSLYWIVMWRKGLATISGKEKIQYQGTYKNEFANQQKKQQDTANIEKLQQHQKEELPAASNYEPSFMSSFQEQQQKNSFKWSYSLLLYIPKAFWMIPLIQLTMSSVLSSFDDIATEYVEFRFNTTSVMAGYQSSLTQVVPIVMAPIMGIVVHKYGRRITSLFFATLILITSMVLLAYTWVNPAVGMIIFSFALALGPVSVLSSTALLLPHELAGTGMGLHKCANNIGTTIVSVLVGYVQDLTYHDGNPHDDVSDLQKEYEGVMILYMCIAAAATLVVVVFWLMDRYILKGWLQADRKERQKRLDLVQSKEQDEKTLYMHANQEELRKINQEKMTALNMIGSRLSEKKSYLYVACFVFWLLVSWVIFFAFALMPIYEDYM